MASKEEALYHKYARVMVKAGNELYLPIGSAKEFIEDCTARSLTVTGVDLFSLRDDMTFAVAPISSIESSSILTKSNSWAANVNQCNCFILETVSRKEIMERVTHCIFVVISEVEYATMETSMYE
ncbi:hypothetical protein ACTID9_22955 [Brevibacillus fluminis]|uniref:hypothetical protein n=1 Tax=Brevibacillus fluminis TaxID=511487 RepID=UPI003F8AFED3